MDIWVLGITFGILKGLDWGLWEETLRSRFEKEGLDAATSRHPMLVLLFRDAVLWSPSAVAELHA